MSTETETESRYLVSQHQPKQAGFVMGAGVISLVLAQVVFGFGIVEAMSGGLYRSANPWPAFLIALAPGVLGLSWVITAFSRLAANVEYVAMSEHLRRLDAAKARDVTGREPDAAER